MSVNTESMDFITLLDVTLQEDWFLSAAENIQNKFLEQFEVREIRRYVIELTRYVKVATRMKTFFAIVRSMHRTVPVVCAEYALANLVSKIKEYFNIEVKHFFEHFKDETGYYQNLVEPDEALIRPGVQKAVLAFQMRLQADVPDFEHWFLDLVSLVEFEQKLIELVVIQHGADYHYMVQTSPLNCGLCSDSDSDPGSGKACNLISENYINGDDGINKEIRQENMKLDEYIKVQAKNYERHMQQTMNAFRKQMAVKSQSFSLNEKGGFEEKSLNSVVDAMEKNSSFNLSEPDRARIANERVAGVVLMGATAIVSDFAPVGGTIAAAGVAAMGIYFYNKHRQEMTNRGTLKKLLLLVQKLSGVEEIIAAATRRRNIYRRKAYREVFCTSTYLESIRRQISLVFMQISSNLNELSDGKGGYKEHTTVTKDIEKVTDEIIAGLTDSVEWLRGQLDNEFAAADYARPFLYQPICTGSFEKYDATASMQVLNDFVEKGKPIFDVVFNELEMEGVANAYTQAVDPKLCLDRLGGKVCVTPYEYIKNEIVDQDGFEGEQLAEAVMDVAEVVRPITRRFLKAVARKAFFEALGERVKELSVDKGHGQRDWLKRRALYTDYADAKKKPAVKEQLDLIIHEEKVYKDKWWESEPVRQVLASLKVRALHVIEAHFEKEGLAKNRELEEARVGIYSQHVAEPIAVIIVQSMFGSGEEKFDGLFANTRQNIQAAKDWKTAAADKVQTLSRRLVKYIEREEGTADRDSDQGPTFDRASDIGAAFTNANLFDMYYKFLFNRNESILQARGSNQVETSKKAQDEHFTSVKFLKDNSYYMRWLFFLEITERDKIAIAGLVLAEAKQCADNMNVKLSCDMRILFHEESTWFDGEASTDVPDSLLKLTNHVKQPTTEEFEVRRAAAKRRGEIVEATKAEAAEAAKAAKAEAEAAKAEAEAAKAAKAEAAAAIVTPVDPPWKNTRSKQTDDFGASSWGQGRPSN